MHYVNRAYAVATIVKFFRILIYVYKCLPYKPNEHDYSEVPFLNTVLCVKVLS